MVRWTPKSEKDLEDIFDHIHKNFDVNLALETVNEIIDHVEELLEANPLAGKLLESDPLFSKLVFKGSSIYYCEHPQTHDIYIVYVRARKTDLDEERITSEEV